MDNTAIARALYDLADVLELGGVAPFKVRAFRTAAGAVEGLSERAADLVESGRITKVKGIGDGVARRIRELLESGRIAELEEHRARLPPGVADLISLPGVGLKTAQQLWQERNIGSVDELEAAAKRGDLADLPRFGEKRQEKLLAGIAAWRERAKIPKRRPIAEALALAESVCARVRKIPGVLACDFAGSLRRRAETIGDLDVLVAAEEADAPAIMEAFATSAEVMEVLGKGETKTSVILRGGMQADLRIVPRSSWGAAMQYFTGSKDHNVAMRTLAVRRQLKVSEYGVFDAAGERIAGETEADVYAAIGLAWMPPELRENRGEVEAAAAGALPELIELEDMCGDLHMHTTESDGASTLEEMVEAARAAGRSYIAITDHTQALTIARGMDRERLAAHVRRIRDLNEKLGGSPRLLAGVETDILPDGSLDLADELGDLDWVVASVHSILAMPRDDMTRRIVRAIESGLVDCLGHPTGRLLGRRDPSAIDVEAVLSALSRAGAAIELNASPSRLDVDEHTARMARDRGVPVVMNSDAHHTRELSYLRYGTGIARRAWLGKEHVLNTRSADDLVAWRAARRAH